MAVPRALFAEILRLIDGLVKVVTRSISPRSKESRTRFPDRESR
jgi:hypothetical protein